MKKPLYLKLLFLLIPFLIAAAPSREFNYTSGNTILSEQNTANENAIFLYLQGGVDTYKDNTIVNEDINTSANIQSDKLNLTSIVQGVNITSSGSFTNAGTFAQSGAGTVTGNFTFAGTTIADLGTVTTAAFTAISDLGAVADTGTITTGGKLTAAANEIEGSAFDINGGTMDGVTIGAETATGMLFVNDASDDADGLGAQGTSGQFLQSAGTGVNPTWAGVASTFVTATTFSSVTDSGEIVIVPDTRYMLSITYAPTNNEAVNVGLRFNSDAGGNYANDGDTLGDSNEIALQSDALEHLAATSFYHATLFMDTVSTDRMAVTGTAVFYKETGPALETFTISGHWDNSDTVADFELIDITGGDPFEFTGEVILYLLNES